MARSGDGLATLFREVAGAQRRGHGSSMVGGEAHFNLEKVLGRAVDLVEALLASIGHGLEDRAMQSLGRLGVGAGAVAGILIGRQFGGVWGVQ